MSATAGRRPGRPKVKVKVREPREPIDSAPADAPELRPSFESAEACYAYTYRETAAGRMPTRRGDTMNTSTRGMVSTLRAKASVGEMEELRGLLKRMEEAAGTRHANENSHRAAATFTAPAVVLGRVRAPDADADTPPPTVTDTPLADVDGGINAVISRQRNSY